MRNIPQPSHINITVYAKIFFEKKVEDKFEEDFMVTVVSAHLAGLGELLDQKLAQIP